jgi:hypothetical protein
VAPAALPSLPSLSRLRGREGRGRSRAGPIVRWPRVLSAIPFDLLVRQVLAFETFTLRPFRYDLLTSNPVGLHTLRPGARGFFEAQLLGALQGGESFLQLGCQRTVRILLYEVARLLTVA